MTFDHMTATADARLSTVLHRDGDLGYSREAVTILAGSGAKRELKLGTVIGRATLGVAVAAADGGNTGNGTLTLDVATPIVAGAVEGVYRVECVAAAANGGTFEVFAPAGYSLGRVDVAATFERHIKFAIADGAADFVVGDLFTITIAAGTGKVVALNPAAVDGTQYAYGVMSMDGQAADGTDGTGQAIARDAVVIDTGLIWPAGITADEKAAAIAQLEDRAIHIAKAI